MYHFCTLFDKNYLFQGMVLYRSLLRTAKEFSLYVLCMDQITYDMINKLNQPNLIPIRLAEIENDETRIVRQRTTHGQFCWVCQPLFCIYILNHFKVAMVTYLEADSMFFSDPAVLFKDLEDYSVSLVPHRYSPKYNFTKTAGKYCVQFNAFRNNEESRKILDYWKIWCFKYHKDKPFYFPGQLSLNDWPIKFKSVKEIQHLGTGVAPWNVQQYKIKKMKEGLFVNDMPLIFYHYHQFARCEDGSYDLGDYSLSEAVVENIYKPYVEDLLEVEDWIQSINPTFIYRKEKKQPKTLKEIMKSCIPDDILNYLVVIYRKLYGIYNVYSEDYFRKD